MISDGQSPTASPGAEAAPSGEDSRLRVLNRFAIDLIGIPSEAALVWYVAQEVVGKLGFSDCVIYLIDSERGLLRQVAAIGDKNPSGDTIANVLEIPIGQGITGHVAKTRKPVVIDDLVGDERYIRDLMEARSEICVPLIVGGEVIGVIDSEDPQPGRFGQEDLDVLSSVAAMTSAKLDLLYKDQALRESEGKFRNLFDTAAAGVGRTLLKDGQVVLANRRLANIFGYDTPEDFTAEFLFSEHYIDPSDRQRLMWSYEHSPGTPIECAFTRKDGSIVTVQAHARANFETGLLDFVAVDITDQILFKTRLEESEERYREIFDQSLAAIWVEDWSPVKQMLEDIVRGGGRDLRDYFKANPERLKRAYQAARILEISRAAIELYGEDSKEALVRRGSAADVIDEELDAFLDTLLLFWSGQMTAEIEAKDMAGDGSEIIVRRRVVIPPSYRENWARVIYTMEDVTERTRTEEQLRQALKMEAVGQLTGGVAHDFNNLLTVIQGNAELLASKIGRDSELLQAIVRSSKRGAELTHRLLAFSRQQSLRPQPTCLSELTGGMTAMLQRSLGEAIEIETVTTACATQVMADPGQIENALLNLAINARDAMPDGGRLTIECQSATLDDDDAAQHAEAAAGDYMVLVVSDTGTGMSAEVQARAFEPFFTTKEVGKGSGLGLSMVYGFAQQSGGLVTIDSKEGQGTTVKVYLPVTEVQEAGCEQGREKVTGDVRKGTGETILVIEDDEQVGATTVRMLEDLGYRTIVVSDAPAASAVLADGRMPDLVLSDVVLQGGVSGPAFAHAARDLYPDLKVVFMSGYPAEAAKRDRFLESGEVLVQKPFEAGVLASALREAIDR